jgi:serine/threonine-protein kinase
MSEAPSLDGEPLSESLGRLVDQVCNRFEAAWQSGQRPRIAGHLSGWEGQPRTALLRELVLLDLDYRRAAGESPGPHDYLGPFPELDADWLANALASPATTGPTPLGETTLEGPPPGLPRRVGDYHVLSEIGRGGMGMVLRVQDPILNRELAVKVVRPELRDRPELLRRFVEEAQITAQLPHPAIVPVVELGHDDHGLPFLAMKLVRGDTLASLLEKRTRPQQDLARFVGIFEQVCQAMAFAHNRRVIHRDLKPENVMVGRFGEVQVMDWGLAKVRSGAAKVVVERASVAVSEVATPRRGEEEPLTAGALGTWRYMPPEQANGEMELVDERADVFSLGGLLCTILTGQPPYVGREGEVRRKAERGDVAEALSRLDSCGADAELVALARECLSPEMDRRPRDAGEVARQVALYERGVQERLRQAEQQRAAAEARAEEAKATARAEQRARRRTVGLVGVVTLALLAGGGAAAWYWQERSTRRARAAVEAEAALTEARTWLDQEADQERRDPERWAASVSLADGALQRAEAAVGSAVVDEGLRQQVLALREQVEPKIKDSRLRVELDRIRLEQTAFARGGFDRAPALPRYRAVLTGYGIDLSHPEVASAVVRASRLRSELRAALEDWARSATDAAERQQLRAVLAAAEPEVDGMRARWRAAVREGNGVALAALAKAGSNLPAADVVNLARDLRRLKELRAAERLLREAHQRYPADFWVNQDLGEVLLGQDPPQRAEAVRYLTAAVALRSHSSPALTNLGLALYEAGQVEEAIAACRQATVLEPKNFKAHNNLGMALAAQGKVAEAITEHRQAIALDPKYATAHTNLGIALVAQGKVAEAITEHRQAIALDPKDAKAHNNLGNALKEQGKVAEGITEYRQAIALDPKDAKTHYNLGNALQAQGQVAEAIAEYRHAIALDPKLAQAHGALGNALKAQGQVAEAIAEYRQAIALDPKYVMAHHNLGLALQEQGQVAEAITEYRQAIDLDAKNSMAHNNLGIALKEQGQVAEAVAEYKKSIEFDPKNALPHYNLGALLWDVKGDYDGAIAEFRQAIALDPKFALAHGALGQALFKVGAFAEASKATRRGLELLPPQHPWRGIVSQRLQQCESAQALSEKLPAILRGEVRPANTPEMLTLAQLCQQHKQLHVAAARFYTDAFAAEPKLAADLEQQHRYNAACSAALAAAGQGKDADKLDARERLRLRRQAVDWLRADLDAWSKLLSAATSKDREAIRTVLEHWQQDTDLASLRDDKPLAALAADERDAWKKLWADVHALLEKVKPR